MTNGHWPSITAHDCNAMTTVKDLMWFNGPLIVLKQLDGVLYLWHWHDRNKRNRDTWLIVRVSPEVAKRVQIDMLYRDALLSDSEGHGLFAMEGKKCLIESTLPIKLADMPDADLPTHDARLFP